MSNRILAKSAYCSDQQAGIN